MTHHADLELSLYRPEADSYALQLRFTLPDSDANTRFLRETPQEFFAKLIGVVRSRLRGCGSRPFDVLTRRMN